MDAIFPRGSAEHIYMLNKIKVLNLIYQENEISRAIVAKKTGISAPTVSRIVASLIEKEKLVTETGIGESSGGRPPVMVRFNGENNFAIGIDWGRTHIKGVIADLKANIIFELDIPSDPENTFEDDSKNVIKLIEQLISRPLVDKGKITGIGIAAAGFVNKKTGTVEFSANFNWRNANIKGPLRERFKIPVIVDNVSRVGAMGEYLYGHGRSLGDFVFINIGYGIGSGIISEGNPYWGYDGFSGEFGHNRVEPLYKINRTCSCGNVNCLECFCSGRGIAETALNRIDDYPDSMVHILTGGKKERITAELVAKAAQVGDKLCNKILEDAGSLMGVSIANLANILNPKTIVLGGKVALAGDPYIMKLKESFKREILRNTQRQTNIILSNLIGNAAVKGAISLVLREVLNLQVFNENEK